ncbi:hypothetical protein [Flagellimonas meridianipacifica]|uniref:Antimicrobial peptide system SdpA family protein n=1 Tax=Flagellimonas meridianipacifica TaxID=1080225 RepID=A0A2T0MBY9_9FLAO|nr:hypothetical protein [Allomuricauda pacifica]PRX54952.1 hypothetical protein CLV81_3357 [Allomuricauda pacifica]
MKYTRRQAAIFSIVALGIVLSPIVQNWVKTPTDSFPFSYYPMFSKKRGATYGLYYVVTYDSLGHKEHLPYRLAGTGGFNQVRRQINKAHRNDGGMTFLKRVEKRLVKKDRAYYHGLTRIELVKGYYHLENYFLNNDTLPLLERNIATLKIKE